MIEYFTAFYIKYNIKYLLQDTEPVTSLAWGPKDDFVLVASRSLQLRAFSLESGRAIRSYTVCCIVMCKMGVDSDRVVSVAGSQGSSCSHRHGWVSDSHGYCIG